MTGRQRASQGLARSRNGTEPAEPSGSVSHKARTSNRERRAPMGVGPGARGAIDNDDAADNARRAVDHEVGAALVDTTQTLVCILDREGRIVRFNPACERVTGWTSEESRPRRARDRHPARGPRRVHRDDPRHGRHRRAEPAAGPVGHARRLPPRHRLGQPAAARRAGACATSSRAGSTSPSASRRRASCGRSRLSCATASRTSRAWPPSRPRCAASRRSSPASRRPRTSSCS